MCQAQCQQGERTLKRDASEPFPRISQLKFVSSGCSKRFQASSIAGMPWLFPLPQFPSPFLQHGLAGSEGLLKGGFWRHCTEYYYVTDERATGEPGHHKPLAVAKPHKQFYRGRRLQAKALLPISSSSPRTTCRRASESYFQGPNSTLHDRLAR